MLVQTHSYNLQGVECHAISKHVGFLNSCDDSRVGITKVGIMLHEFVHSHIVLFRGAPMF